jgi:hypothetical protein
MKVKIILQQKKLIKGNPLLTPTPTHTHYYFDIPTRLMGVVHSSALALCTPGSNKLCSGGGKNRNHYIKKYCITMYNKHCGNCG